MKLVICLMCLAIGYCCTAIRDFPETISNIADKGFPTQSDNFNGDGNLIIDGDTSRVIDDGTFSEYVRSGPEAWWMLTFEDAYLIDQIRLWNVQGTYASFLVGASIYVDDVQVGIIRRTTKSPMILSLKDLYVVGSSIKIMGAGHPLLLAEVEVWGAKICYVNIAGEGTASQIDGYNPNYAIDGIIDGLYEHNSVTHTLTGGEKAWWKLNFGAVRWICGIVLYNRMDCCQERLNGGTIYVGDTLVGEVEFVSGKQSYHFWNVKKVSDTITIKGGAGVISLAEVEVFEC